MRRFLVLNSLLLLAISVLAQMSITADTEEVGVDIREYNVLMQVRGREMTGICVMQTEADSSIVGTLITEMGVKIFDFTYSNGKAKVMNVIAPLNNTETRYGIYDCQGRSNEKKKQARVRTDARRLIQGKQQ